MTATELIFSALRLLRDLAPDDGKLREMRRNDVIMGGLVELGGRSQEVVLCCQVEPERWAGNMSSMRGFADMLLHICIYLLRTYGCR